MSNGIGNAFKKILFRIYLGYEAASPIGRGKGFLGRALGRAVFDVNGVQMELDATSALDRHLLRRTPGFDAAIHDAVRRTLGQGGVFLDIGANIGYYSLLAAQSPGVRVFAFEPSPRELARLYRNIGLNGFSNITVFPYGLSDQRATLPLHLSGGHNPGANSVLNLSAWTAYDTTVDCPFETFDALMPRCFLPEVRLCKLDVEGFELPVLRGMAESMAAMPNAAFIVEISPRFLGAAGYAAEDIYRFFAEHGYRPTEGAERAAADPQGQYDELFLPDNA